MISREEVQNLAALARLSLTDNEVSALQKDISSILEYIGQLRAANIPAAGTEPGVENVMRADEARGEGDPLWGKEEALREAFPAREGGFNRVRKVLEKDA